MMVIHRDVPYNILLFLLFRMTDQLLGYQSNILYLKTFNSISHLHHFLCHKNKQILQLLILNWTTKALVQHSIKFFLINITLTSRLSTTNYLVTLNALTFRRLDWDLFALPFMYVLRRIVPNSVYKRKNKISCYTTTRWQNWTIIIRGVIQN